MPRNNKLQQVLKEETFKKLEAYIKEMEKLQKYQSEQFICTYREYKKVKYMNNGDKPLKINF